MIFHFSICWRLDKTILRVDGERGTALLADFRLSLRHEDGMGIIRTIIILYNLFIYELSKNSVRCPQLFSMHCCERCFTYISRIMCFSIEPHPEDWVTDANTRLCFSCLIWVRLTFRLSCPLSTEPGACQHSHRKWNGAFVYNGQEGIPRFFGYMSTFLALKNVFLSLSLTLFTFLYALVKKSSTLKHTPITQNKIP